MQQPTPAVNREEGFRAAFDGTDFELMETQYGEGDAAKSQSIAENYITQGVVGIFGCNEGSTTGAGNAIKASGNDTIVGVGFDKSDAILNLIEDGYLLCNHGSEPGCYGLRRRKSSNPRDQRRGSWRRSNRYRCIRIDKRREINKAQCNVRPSQILRRFCALTKLTIIRKCERIRKTKTLLGNSGIREGIWG